LFKQIFARIWYDCTCKLLGLPLAAAHARRLSRVRFPESSVNQDGSGELPTFLAAGCKRDIVPKFLLDSLFFE